MKSILLITEQLDPNVDNLIQELLRRGISYLRWNLDRYPQDSSLTYRATTTGFEGAIETDGRVVSFDDIGSVWYRTYRASGFPAGLNSDQREFAGQEAEMALEALPLVAKWQWINDPRHHRQATRKSAQLSTARRLGFAIPQTIISNDPGKIRAFCDRGGSEIYLQGPVAVHEPGARQGDLHRGRHLAGFIVPGPHQTHARDLPGTDSKSLRGQADGGRRHDICGQDFFAREEQTRIDWRVAPYELKYEPTDLPQDIRYLVAAFMAEFNLVYSCLDFIVTPEGEYVFLESNPGGQYLWIEHLTGLPITETIVDALLWASPS